MAEYPSLPLFTDAYLSDTRHLTAAQHGAYLLLLMTAWRMPDCALPDDDSLLSRWACMDYRTWERNKSVVMAFWEVGDDTKWRQRRLLDERNYVSDMRSKKSAAGKASALKKKDRHSTAVKPNGNTFAAPTPIPTPKKEVSNPPIDPREESFERFWEIFPKTRRGNKDKAYAAWKSALTRDNEENIYEGIKRYASSDEVARGFAKGAAAWLNDDRWGNDYSTPRAGTSIAAAHADSVRINQNPGQRFEQPPSKWQTAAARVLDKIDRGEI